MRLISFIVPVYNLKQDEVKKCISSLVNQSCTDYEIIIVDDGSSNGIEKYCDILGEEFSIKIIHQPNQGLAVARNTGMSAADGKWIVHVDGDDWVDVNLAEELRIKEQHSNADIIVWGFVLDSGLFQQELLLKNKHAFDGSFQDIKENVLCSILDCDSSFSSLSLNTSWAKAYRADYIRNNNLFYDNHLRRAQDAVYNLRAFSKATSVEYIDKALNFYRNDNISLSRGYNPKTYDYLLLTAKAIKAFVEKEGVTARVKESSVVFIQRCFRMTANQLYLHKDNPMTYAERKRMFLNALMTEPYNSAFRSNISRNRFLFKIEDYFYKKHSFCGVFVYSKLFAWAYMVKKIIRK